MPLYLDIGYELLVSYGDMPMVWPFWLQVDVRTTLYEVNMSGVVWTFTLYGFTVSHYVS